MAKNYNIVSKNSFLSKKRLNKEYVELEDGTGMFIREMTGADIEVISQKSSEKVSNVEALALIIALSACDEDGNLLFTLEDIPAIMENNGIETLVKLSDVAVKISKLNPNAINGAKENLKNV